MVKNRIYRILNFNDDNDKIDVFVDRVIMILIVLTALSIVLESFEQLRAGYSTFFRAFEVFSVIIFSIEYILRIWTADIKYPHMNRFKAIIKYVFSFMAVIDLLAILPFYLQFFVPLFIPFDLRFLRMVRAFRLFGLFKLGRYTQALSLISKVIKDRKDELMTTIFILFFIVMVSSTMIYYIESNMQPDKFPNIVASFWWAVATLTTVGYGDVFPLTAPGKILASVIAIAGIGLVALPTGIISSGFMEEMKNVREQKENDTLVKLNYLYPSVVHFDNNGYLVRVVDFDCCYSYANTLEEAVCSVSDELSKRIRDGIVSGKKLPAASSVSEMNLKSKEDFIMMICVKNISLEF